jgi:hypothetical protein
MINNYTSLQAAIADWLHRSDLTSVIPSFVQLAEERLNHDLAARAMIITDTVQAAAGQSLVTLPTDILEVSRVQIDTSPIRVLTPISADEMAAKHPDNSSGLPGNYAIVGASMQLGPSPDSNYDISITYRQHLPSLLTNADNWLVLSNPTCYLFASLLAAATYLRDDGLFNVIFPQYQNAIEALNKSDWCTVATPRVSAR